MEELIKNVNERLLSGETYVRISVSAIDDIKKFKKEMLKNGIKIVKDNKYQDPLRNRVVAFINKKVE